MKKCRIIGCLFLCIFILSSCTHTPLYINEGDAYVDKTSGYHYTQGIEKGWRPISSEQELLGFVGTGNSMPVYGFQGDTQRAVIYVGEYGSNEAQPGFYHRTDLLFPEISTEGITSVLYIPKSNWEMLMASDNERGLATAAVTDSITDTAILSVLIDTITNGQRILLPLLTPDKEYGQAFTMQWAGIILFLNHSFPGLSKTMNVYSDAGKYYLVTRWDAKNMAECIALPTELVKELYDMQP